MKIGIRGVLMAVAAATVACGGGGGGSDSSGGTIGPSPTPVTAAFAPDSPIPPSNTFALLEGSKTGDLVTVRATLTNATGVYGVAFEITYDSAKVAYVSYSAGTLLEQGGQTPTYQVSVPTAGRVVVAASRNGNVAAVNASGTVDVIRLTFRAKTTGASRGEFGLSPVVYDGQAPPQPKAGISWTAGTFQGS